MSIDLLKRAFECGMRGVQFRPILLHNVRINKKTPGRGVVQPGVSGFLS